MRSATATALTLAWAKKHVKALPVPVDGASGVDGAPGPAGADGKDGAQGPQGYGFAPVGKYENGKVYFGASPENPYFQVVEYQGSSYAALDADGVGGRPPGPGWVLLAAKGGKGDGGSRIGGSAIPVPYDHIDFDEVPDVPGQPRRLMWNATDGTLDLGMNNGNVTQQIGLEQFFRVKATAAITNGQCVMFTGTLGNSGVLLAAPVSGTPEPQHIMGVATEDIAHNEFGFVTSFGKVRGVQTNGANYGETWADGTVLYANPAITGGMTSVRPELDPVIVAVVVNAHASNGEFFVRVTHDGVRWDRISGRPASATGEIVTVTTSTTLTSAHYTVLVDATAGDVSINLPAAAGASGRVYNVKKIDATANEVIFVGTVDGDTDKRISSRYTSVTVQSNGTSWWII
jgi:hypothetical protein